MDTLFIIDKLDPNNRLIRAKQKIPKEKLILKTSALIVAPFSHKRHEYCNYCLKIKEKLSKCGVCSYFHYCSESCQKLDWPIHKYECKIIKEIIGKQYPITNQFLLVLRCLICNRHNLFEMEKFLSDFISNTFKFSPDKLIFFEEMSIMMIKYLKLEINNQDELINSIVSLTTKLMINAFTIYAEDNDTIASAIYHPANFFNHSCKPNTFVIYKSRTQYIYSNRDIDEGEEITITYCDNIKPFYDRQHFLQESYFFECKCAKCIDKLDQAKTMLKCPKCLKGEIVTKNLKEYNCTQCNENYIISDILKFESNLKDMIKKLAPLKPLERDEMYKSFSKIITPNNANYRDIMEIMSRMYLGEERYNEAYQIDKEIVKKMQVWYASNDPTLGWKFCEITKLVNYLEKYNRVKKYTAKALEILNSYYTSDELKELKEISYEIDTQFKFQLPPE